MAHQVVWFDAPVVNLERAVRFYSRVLAVEMKQEFPGQPVAVFAHGPSDVSGCLYQEADVQPSGQGILIYFNVNGRLEEAERLVEELGGKVLRGRHQIGPFGWRSIVLDSEGNRIALHSE
jgi:hypothetical protein